MADGDKKAVNGDIALIAVLIRHGDAGKLALTVQCGYAAIKHKLDIVLGLERLDELCFAAERVSAVDKIHLAAGVGKEHCVLKRRVSAAVHGNGATLVKCTVTHGAEANSGADKLRLTFNSPEMQSLYKQLDMAQKLGIHVNLTLWGAHISHFLSGHNRGNWVVAPYDYQEWAENFSILIRHLLLTKHYTCIL